MPNVSQISGVKEVLSKLKSLEKGVRNQREAAATVGFTANYALFVHENVLSSHNIGQAKFLERPAREKANELAGIVKRTFLRTNDLDKSLLLAALRLQREAQKITPIDTGALRASAFTSLTKDEDSAAEQAFRKFQQVKNQ